MPAPSEVKQRKPRATKPYVRKTAAADSQEKPKKPSRPRLTLEEWLEIVAYFDNHKGISQPDVVKHFRDRLQKPLHFDQGSLSRHLSVKGRAADQEQLLATPTSLTGKKIPIVTRPDVEAALVLWVKHMDQKKEHATGPMFMAKRAALEKAMNVPEEERLHSNGWVQKFCRRCVNKFS